MIFKIQDLFNELYHSINKYSFKLYLILIASTLAIAITISHFTFAHAAIDPRHKKETNFCAEAALGTCMCCSYALAPIFELPLSLFYSIRKKLNPPGKTFILIVDAEKGTVTKKGGLSYFDWGYKSTAVVGNKVVMGPGDNRGNSILIIDTVKETVIEKSGDPKYW